MKNRNKENGPFNNLDSFLDTLFNVAGILIIFLIMIQLSASGMMETMDDELKNKQIVLDSINSSRVKLAKASARNSQVAGDISTITGKAASMEDKVESLKHAIAASEVELENLAGNLKKSLLRLGIEAGEHWESDLLNRANQAGEYAELFERLENKGKELKEAQRALRVDEAKKYVEAHKELESKRKELAKALKALKETRLLHSNKYEIRVPILRDPPIGSTAIWLYCRYGKIAPASYSKSLAQKFFKEVRAVMPVEADGDLADPNFNPPIFATRTQAKLIKEHFGLAPISNDYLRLSFDQEGYVAFRVNPRGKGDDEKSILKQNSRFKDYLNKYNPDSHHLKFLVWEDSFPVYLEARAIADGLGYKCGWQPAVAWQDNVITLNQRLYPTRRWKQEID